MNPMMMKNFNFKKSIHDYERAGIGGFDLAAEKIKCSNRITNITGGIFFKN